MGIAEVTEQTPHLRTWDLIERKGLEAGVNGILMSPPAIGTGKVDATYKTMERYVRELTTWAGEIELSLVWMKKLALKRSWISGQ